MKRIKITAMCISLLATLSMVGCVCSPGLYSGVPKVGYASPAGYGYGSVCDDGCSSCGPQFDCGVVEYGCNSSMPHPAIVDCRTSFSNLGNGVLLVGRGVLDITAAPFIVVGKVLSSGCRYEVLTYCPEVAAPVCAPSMSVPCDPVITSGCASGCDSCNHGYGNGHSYGNGYMQESSYDFNTQSRAIVPPSMQRRSNSVVQASYLEPTAPAVRFSQPR